jgi:hypothetical protein
MGAEDPRAALRDAIPGVLGLLKAQVREAVGAAIAAVLLDKPLDQVTPEEGAAALANPIVAQDHPRSARAVRAGIRALTATLALGVIPVAFAQLIEDGLVALDEGQVKGWTKPAPGRRGQSGDRTFRKHWLAIEVNYQETRRGCTRSHAIGFVTGRWRGKRAANAPPPSMPSTAALQDLWRQVKAGEALDLNPDAIAEARAVGESEARGGKPSADFLRRRSEYITEWNRQRPRTRTGRDCGHECLARAVAVGTRIPGTGSRVLSQDLDGSDGMAAAPRLRRE